MTAWDEAINIGPAPARWMNEGMTEIMDDKMNE